MKLNERQQNVIETLARMHTVNRPWLSLSILDSYDGRTITALMNRGLIEINTEYGFRVNK